MSNPIIPKRNANVASTTPPASGDLQVGELATNIESGKVYLKANSGVIDITADRVATSQLTTLATPNGVVQLLGTGKLATAQIPSLTTAELGCLTSVAVANFVPQLDGDGKIPVALLPSSVLGGLRYKGAWTVNTSPVIASGGVVGTGTATVGDYYVAANTATVATAIDGVTSFIAGDLMAFGGDGKWERIHGASSEVISVNNVAPVNGNVTVTASDVGAVATTALTTAATPDGVPKLTGAGKLSTSQLIAATTAELGAIRVGTGLTIDGAGILSANGDGYTLPKATGSMLGGVKIGTGIAIDGDGKISADNTVVITTSSSATTFNGGTY
jgi:hypothetical protein